MKPIIYHGIRWHVLPGTPNSARHTIVFNDGEQFQVGRVFGSVPYSKHTNIKDTARIYETWEDPIDANLMHWTTRSDESIFDERETITT